MIVNQIFLAVALLRLGERAAGCEEIELGPGEQCMNRVYGMRPSSLLTILVSGKMKEQNLEFFIFARKCLQVRFCFLDSNEFGSNWSFSLCLYATNWSSN